MPGSSLWLIPNPDSQLYKTLATLIEQDIPAIYPIAIPPQFNPHVTLTADTAPEPNDPQKWLDDLTLPVDVNSLEVIIKEAQVGQIFFRKLTLRCEKTDGLKALAGACRRAGTGEDEGKVEKWVEETYAPHVSLMYSDLPRDAVEAKMEQVGAVIEKVKVERDGLLMAEGAEIWLVPTFKDIGEWQPVARRRVEGVRWRWQS